MKTSPIRSAILLCLLALAPSAALGQVSVISGLFNEQAVSSGQSYEGTIVVKNETAEPQEARVYSTDYLFFADGSNIYGDPESHGRSNAGWISFSPDYFVIPPTGTTTVTYSVSVPSDPQDTLSGTYWSMIMVEGIAQGSPESTRQPSDVPTQVGIHTTIRFGVQIATQVAGGAERKIAFANPGLEATEEGLKVLNVDLVNEGTLLVQPKIWVELYDAQGAAAGRIEDMGIRLYPGTSSRQQFDLTAIQTGKYQALVFVDAGDGNVFGAQYSLDL